MHGPFSIIGEVCPWAAPLSLRLCIQMHVCMFACMLVCLSVCLFVRARLSVYMSVCQSECLRRVMSCVFTRSVDELARCRCHSNPIHPTQQHPSHLPRTSRL